MKLFLLLLALTGITNAQQFDANGLPLGFAEKADKSIVAPPNNTSPTPQKTAPKKQTEQYQTKEIEKALDDVPTGKYIGKLPDDLYLQLVRGKEGEHALKLLRKWENQGLNPLLKYNGKLLFTYGSGTPVIIVKPTDLTDIELEEGEKINDILIGDSIRWIVTPTMNGKGLTQTSHVIIKAKKPNLTTSLIITTDRRSYRLRLVSSNAFHMPLASFTFPEAKQKQAHKEYLLQLAALEKQRLKIAEDSQSAQQEKIKELQAQLLSKEDRLKNEAKAKEEELALRPLDPSELDFRYQIANTKGRPTWRPTSVYNDGQKTYIVMPKGMISGEAPILLIKDGRNKELVNYRLIDNKYVVDRVFNKAIMVSGVGWGRKEIQISRTLR